MQPSITKPDIKSASPLAFFKEVRTELGKVVWPSRKETIRLTAVVIGVSLAIGCFIGALDLIFTKLTELMLGK
jgi:preprotein translocase subunit SecE